MSNRLDANERPACELKWEEEHLLSYDVYISLELIYNDPDLCQKDYDLQATVSNPTKIPPQRLPKFPVFELWFSGSLWGGICNSKIPSYYLKK